jgi:hypothetical protein
MFFTIFGFLFVGKVKNKVYAGFSEIATNYKNASSNPLQELVLAFI